jgi:dTDP-4-dehydrorhamnose 3,5-epimerase
MDHKKHSIFSEVIVFTPKVFSDERGYFFESYNKTISSILKVQFLQENHSKSKKNVFRGFHYQWQPVMGKLLRVVSGSGLGVILDIRKSSLTYKQTAIIPLNDTTNQILWTPAGFAQGFLSLEDNTHLCYKCTSVRNEQFEGAIHPLSLDLDLNKESIILSEKDKNAMLFEEYDKNPKFK